MAKFTVDQSYIGMTDFKEIPADLGKEILNEQADYVLNAQKQKAITYGLSANSETVSSLKIGAIRKSKIGGSEGMKVSIKPVGDHSQTKTKGMWRKKTYKGVTRTNAEVAFITNYGVPRRNIRPRPFITEANAESAQAIEDIAKKHIDKYLEGLKDG